MTEESGVPDGARTRNTLEYVRGRGEGDNILTYSETLQRRVRVGGCVTLTEVGVAFVDFRTDDISAQWERRGIFGCALA